uniref:Uncharacterized protein n=1 Tax=Chelativorans sp. (strain BNC1) TaxID=266779 RepID=Q11M64_CHESB
MAFFDAGALPPDGVLKAEDLARLRKTEEIEIAARRKAAQYLRRARQGSGHIRRKAREAGYAEALFSFSEAIRRLDEERGRLQADQESRLRHCLQQIVGRMPKEEWLSHVLHEVLGELQGRPEIVIMVHPDHLDAITTAIAAVRRRGEHVVPIRPEPNPRMCEHDCLVYAGPDVIDLSLTVVVEEMIAALHIAGAVVRTGGEN